MKKYDYLIVGAGLFGSTFAYEMTKRGKKCLVIDRRNHIGGNIYCENINGINVHKYGAHIFHTSDREIWKYVNQFTEFNNYINSPVANYKGELYNLPFNMNTFTKLWGIVTPKEAQEKIEEQKRKYYYLTIDDLRYSNGEKHNNDSYNKRIINTTKNKDNVFDILNNASNIYVVMGCFVKYEYVSAEPPSFLEVENLLRKYSANKLLFYSLGGNELTRENVRKTVPQGLFDEIIFGNNLANGSKTIDPHSNTTRAEAVTMIQRYINKFN